MRSNETHCLYCKQPLPQTRKGPKRICVACKSPIGRHDRWEFTLTGPQHKDCQQPLGVPPLAIDPRTPIPPTQEEA